MLAFQTNGPQERRTIGGWVVEHGESNAALVDELPTLGRGDAFVWSPQWLQLCRRIHIAERVTYDASSTPTQKAKQVKPESLTSADLAALGEAMKATVETAKANDPRELRRQIAGLKIELLAAKSSTLPEANSLKPVLTNADRELLRGVTGRLVALDVQAREIATTAEERATRLVQSALAEYLNTTRNVGVEVVDGIAKALERVDLQKILTKLEGVATAAPGPGGTTAARVTPHSALRTPHQAPAAPRSVARGDSHTIDLPPGELATLTAALQYDGLDRKRLGILTGYKRSSRDAYIVRLASKGLVEVRGTQLFATDAGRAALNGSFEPLPTGDALVEHWRQRLPEGERKTLDVLLDAKGGEVVRETIDEATGYKRSSRDAYLVRLKARGLVVFAGRGMVKASDELFD